MKDSLPVSNFNIDFVQSKLLYLLLLRSGQYTFLPDLFDAINEDNNMMIRLLSLFAGQKISFPTPDRIAKHVRDIKIFCRLCNLRGRNFTSVASELSSEFGLSDSEVHRRYNIMNGIANEAGIRVPKRRS